MRIIIPLAVAVALSGCVTSAPSLHHLHLQPGQTDTSGVADAADAFLDGSGELLNIARDALVLEAVWIDDLAMGHARYRQVVEGVPVYGHQLTLHVSAEGDLERLTDDLIRDLQLNTRPSYSEQDAKEIAFAEAGWGQITAADLYVLEHQGHVGLAWRIDLLDETEGAPRRPVVWVDAHRGSVVWSYDALTTNRTTSDGVGRWNGAVELNTWTRSGTTYLEDTLNNVGTYTYNGSMSGASYVTDTDGAYTSSDQRNAVDAHYAASATLDFLDAGYGFIGLNGRGGPGTVTSLTGSGGTIAVYTDYGRNYANAFWDGRSLTLGSGDGYQSGPMTGMDVVAHEMAHGLIENTANLVYQNEPGALNEHFADVIGAMVERSVYGESDDTWAIGEAFWTPGISGDALRYFDSPRRDGQSPDHYRDRYTGWADNGGVHINSGIPNHAFYLLATGAPHATYGERTLALGSETAMDIWFRALTQYLGPYSDFADARVATIAAAEDLFGRESIESKAVANAWAAVGVGAFVALPSTGTNASSDASGCRGARYDGTLSAQGAQDIQPDGSYFYSEGGPLTASLSGPTSADFDLALYSWDGSSWVRVSNSAGSSSEEVIQTSVDSGYYLWAVTSYAGAGAYTLCLED